MVDGTGVTSDDSGMDSAGGAGSQVSDQTAIKQIDAESSHAAATARMNDPEDPVTGGINPRTAGAKMHAAQVATTAAIGAGFEFTPEQVEAQLTHCQHQLNELNNDLVNAQEAAQAVHEPAPDAASVAQADAVRNMLTSTVGVIKADIAFLTDWQSKLIQAKMNYMTNERLTDDQWSQLAKGLQV